MRLRCKEFVCAAVALTCGLALCVEIPVLSFPLSVGQARFRGLSSSVVRVRRETSEGSGVVVRIPDCGIFILTASHVVAFGNGPIVVQSSPPRSGLWRVAGVLSPLDPELDLSLLTAPRELSAVALPLAGGVTSTLAYSGRRSMSKALAIGFPLGAATSRLISGGALPRLPIPLSGGYDIPLRMKVRQGMSGGLLAYEGSSAIQGILGLHADPAWSQDLTYLNGGRVSPALQRDYERLSFAISSAQILQRLSRQRTRLSVCSSAARPSS